MTKILTADEMRFFQKEASEAPSEEVSIVLSKIIDKAKEAVMRNSNQVTYWFEYGTSGTIFVHTVYHLNKLGYSILDKNFGYDMRGDWCTFVRISW